ncbi:uncharacterized protein M437DRAFT_56360 [Aureobasidium melanogenum CBS 110374]|uniref:Uncharacterized protein n=1 Tax=Aureobasidium melanogenum (strain CBS 110374) TaxID=1043003 RepID=A0A074VPA1_AURM1|nr:uncharacterized protein M437DRAFT_56360 [Aureobasidium melanogenum CBS 110374]KEQ59522.1 hypothetical protein M437DRAFT_56360 [Aureobasidium melanogenum CBS 110374]
MLDPEYRQRKQQYQTERYHKQMLDPEYRQKRAEVSRKFYADRRRDIEWFRQHVYAANKRFHDRIFADDAMRQNKNAYSAKWNKQRYCADPQFRLYHGLKKWYRLQREHLSQFVWEHWRPIYHQDKVERTCATCATTRINGSRLWFERKNTSDCNSTSYDCLGCYAESKWSKIVPMEAKGASRFYKPRDPEVLAMLEAREKE